MADIFGATGIIL